MDQHGATSSTLKQAFSFSVLADSSSKNIDWATMPMTPIYNDNASLPHVLLRQGDGKIVLAGSDFITRFNVDLTLDTTFGPQHNGIVNTNFGASMVRSLSG